LHYIYKLSNGVLIKYFPDKEKWLNINIPINLIQ
jgi:hypothetical protein